MLKSKQLFINVALVVLAICVGVGTIMAVKADGFTYDCDISEYKHFYINQDGDDFGDSSATSTFACKAPLNYIDNNLDCDDTNASINPDADEICDGIDNNCDGNINEGLATSTYFMDADGDGYGDASSTMDWCGLPEGYVSRNQDCDDADVNINPDADEICDAFDNNCDGNINEGLATSTYFMDADGDGYGDASSTINWCGFPDGYVSQNQDCDDSNASTSPAAAEICGDEIDNNCNGEIDENCDEPTATTTTYYLDADGDGYGDPTDSISSTTQPTGYVLDNTDCDDASATTSPGAIEICGDGIDNDCSGGDEVCAPAETTYYSDEDGDGYGDPADSISSTTQPTGYILDNTDCDDSNASINPGEDEVCGDGIDNDCSNGDEICAQTYYSDEDGDGYGDPADSISSTTQPTGYVLDNTDCDDTDADVNPGEDEICLDEIDNNCDGNIDIDCIYNGDGDDDIFTGCDPFGNSFSNHGGFVSCLAHYTNWLKSNGEITGREKGQIMSANANKFKNNNGNNGKSNSNNGKARGKKK